MSSDASYDQDVENALEDLRKMEANVINQKIEVNGAWDVEDEVSENWDDATYEVRLQSMGSAIEKYMSDGMFLTAARLLGFFETNAEKALKDHYRLMDLSTLYSDVLEALKSEIEFFNNTNSGYKLSHKVALTVVKLHENEDHDSPSESSHTVSTLTKYTCRDNLPSFSCRGNYLAGKTVCNESYNTPNKAIYTHQLTCGEEEDEVGNKTSISGDGIHYYTCDPIGFSKHRVRECKLNAIDKDGNEDVCGKSYRRCMKLKYDHDLRPWRRGTTLHSDSSDESADAGDSYSGDQQADAGGSPDCDMCTSTSECSTCSSDGGESTSTDGSHDCASCASTSECSACVTTETSTSASETNTESTSASTSTPTAPGLYPVGASLATVNGQQMPSLAPGDSHTAKLITKAGGYAIVHWYLLPPGDSRHYGDELFPTTYAQGPTVGTEVTFSFTIPSRARGGVYKLTAYIYPHSSAADQTCYEYSYYIYVS